MEQQKKLSTKQKMTKDALLGVGVGALYISILTIKSIICDDVEERKDKIYETVRNGLAISASYIASATVLTLTDDD